MSNMKYIPVSRVWELESWGIEFGGMISALSITIDALNDSPDSNSVELDAANGILCSLLKLKREFDTLYSDISNSAVKADKIPTE